VRGGPATLPEPQQPGRGQPGQRVEPLPGRDSRGGGDRAGRGLPPEQREVIVMRIWAQMTLTEIAQVTGEAMSTLFSRYRAGLSEIKRIMESSCHMKNKI